MNKKRNMVYLCGLLLLAVTTGCASTPEAPSERRRLFFPKPPEIPRIEFVKTYQSQHNFPKSGTKLFFEKIFGREAAVLFSRPLDVASDGSGIVYVSDLEGGIIVYDLVNYKIDRISLQSLGFTPFGLAVDGDKRLYVTSSSSNIVRVFDAFGSPLLTISDEMDWPTGVAVDDRLGRIYVANSHGHNVTVYDKKGKYLFAIGKRGKEAGDFNFPVDVDVAPDGKLAVADAMNSRVQTFDSSGKPLKSFGRKGDGMADFDVIKGIAVDSVGHIYVTDGGASNIKIYDFEGNFLMTLGARYPIKRGRIAAGGFLMPTGISADGKNGIYVADQFNRMIQVFQYLDEEYLRSNPLD